MRPRAQGFSLLEAIVALVLVSTLAVTLFGWINGNFITLRRVHDANAKSEATVNILEYMRSVNPMQAREGEATLGLYRIRWRAQPIVSPVDRAESIYQFGLYDTHVNVNSIDNRPWFNFVLRQVGHKKVRTSAPD